MTTLVQLWMPILIAAVAVFAASSLIHMVFKWHQPEYRKLPNEEELRTLVRSASVGPGQYFVPYCSDPKEMGTPEMVKKFTEGPNGILTLRAPGPPSMGKPLVLWFALIVVVATGTAYLTARILPVGAGFLAVCRVAGLVTLMAYATGSISTAIWMGKPWSSALKEVLDAFIYGLVTAVTFGWLWPR